MILYTTDNENGYISEGADLKQYDNIEALKADVTQNSEDFEEGDFYISDVQTDDFADCWIKINKFDAELIADLEAEAGYLNLRTTHPGQSRLWISPVATVYVPVWTEI